MTPRFGFIVIVLFSKHKAKQELEQTDKKSMCVQPFDRAVPALFVLNNAAFLAILQ